MIGSTRQRCFHHSDREASARCPSCHRSYCRECITEHSGRLLCASCLAERSPRPRSSSLKLTAAVAPLLTALIGFAVAEQFFHLLGLVLLNIPGLLHEGTLWTALTGGQP
ncbi:MAG: rhomboid family protein [Polyangiaceae bacterium]|nr:rhomboid family protein [Polyangiaceae bacterium]